MAGFFADVMDSSLLVAADRAAAPSAIPPLPALVERAESVRGEVLALRQDLDAAHFSSRAADRRRVPEPEIVAGTKSSTACGGDLGSVLTVQAVVPLFDRGRPERALANARASQATARLDAFRLALQTEIVTLRAAALERRDTAERYRATALNGAGEIARIAQVSYDAGERSILELLDAYRTASSARLRQSALDFAARQAEIELEFASGWEMP
jgi:cobalt-zinc-cadmium efflux system outer membrane protein